MSQFRDHSQIVISEFNGLFARGGIDSTPLDHFSECNNVAFIQNGFRWRDGIDTYLGLADVVRVYTYTKQTSQSLLVLTGAGIIYDTAYPTTALLTKSGMTDFGFVSYAGRAYITPCDGITGLTSEFLYVYLGAGVAARKAAGAKPKTADGAFAAANSATAGNVEAGIHVFAVIYETDTGFLTAIGPTTLPTVTAPGDKKVALTAISVSPNSYVTKRHIIATKAINPTFYTGDTTGYQFFFLPDGEITNNTATTLTVNFFDSELLEDASYLLDMFEEIPAGVGLGIYHNRLLSYGEYANSSVVRISVAGEPEAINQVDGLITFPLDGNPVTNAQEFRDVLYVTKKTKTNAWSDTGSTPDSWPMTVLDQGIGAGLHGIAKVLDSEGVNVDYLIIAGFSGIYLFNGAYQDPELTWKIRDFWLAVSRVLFHKVQLLNDTTSKILYCVLPDGTMLIGDYSNQLDAKNIRFSPWTFDPNITSIALIENDSLILASDGERVS